MAIVATILLWAWSFELWRYTSLTVLVIIPSDVIMVVREDIVDASTRKKWRVPSCVRNSRTQVRKWGMVAFLPPQRFSHDNGRVVPLATFSAALSHLMYRCDKAERPKRPPDGTMSKQRGCGKAFSATIGCHSDESESRSWYVPMQCCIRNADK